MTVLIVKHADCEEPDVIEDCLSQETISYRILSLQHWDHLPRVDDLHHVVLLGRPMNVREEEHYPFLEEEDLFIRRRSRRENRF